MPFSGAALSTVSINIEGYSQDKAENVSTFAHDYDIVCMQETHIGPEHCRPSIQGMKLIAETRHRKYGSAVFAKPTLNIEEVHTEVTDSQIELKTVSLAKITAMHCPFRRRFNLKKANWSKFTNEIDQAIANIPAHPTHYNDFVDLVKKAARHNIPR